jgi:hypothetical protein
MYCKGFFPRQVPDTVGHRPEPGVRAVSGGVHGGEGDERQCGLRVRVHHPLLLPLLLLQLRWQTTGNTLSVSVSEFTTPSSFLSFCCSYAGRRQVILFPSPCQSSPPPPPSSPSAAAPLADDR